MEPGAVWSHFAALCAIPRPSTGEAALRDHLLAWARAAGIEASVDPVGNLILRKPASPGGESRPGVVLQGHLDMVCQANAGTPHDFTRDPIRAIATEGWVAAADTTLGADNGIGVALALAALETPGLSHPPLEVLLTVNEESGMDGARGLAAGSLRGKTLINLDSEEWGRFYLGCAGGVDVEVGHAFGAVPLPEARAVWRLELAGLLGGHSGLDIQRGRGNAIQLMAEALLDLAGHVHFDLLGLAGGTARNAIPREAWALIAVPEAEAERCQASLSRQADGWQERFRHTDPGLTLTWAPGDGAEQLGLRAADRDRLLGFLASADNGVAAWSEAFPDVVETSANLGVARLAGGDFSATFKVRSLDDGQADRLADRLVAHAGRHGMAAAKHGYYPGWKPNPDSPLLALCQRVYREQFGAAATVQVIHAGLECGLFAASHPQLDMISFGPDIRGAHAPGERVEIASVARCWTLLQAILRTLASTPDEAAA